MKKKLQVLWKKWLLNTKLFLITYVGKAILRLLLSTCKFHVEGCEQFLQLAKRERCIMMLWHNRVAIAPYILTRFTPQINYAAVVSASRDGELLSAIVRSYKQGSTIKVGHQTRYEALHELIRHVKEETSIAVLTPDGPRGPRYKMKPGVAMAALEAKAYVVSLNWEADSFWELNTWDRLRFPKPFTRIHVAFGTAIHFDTSPQPSLDEALALLEKKLSNEF